ncbi:uncharacterized protein RSE6_14288 [Rhynchosporium secalis]|uniref:Hsp70 protein n=1 Tax=Rhynchosporium secalis TaxID=38038 RepID=A0A1E1MUY0_RHYSE|nr:uncharacterized protein RSE6_14288 [Rhynchosporium secalis]
MPPNIFRESSSPEVDEDPSASASANVSERPIKVSQSLLAEHSRMDSNASPGHGLSGAQGAASVHAPFPIPAHSNARVDPPTFIAAVPRTGSISRSSFLKDQRLSAPRDRPRKPLSRKRPASSSPQHQASQGVFGAFRAPVRRDRKSTTVSRLGSSFSSSSDRPSVTEKTPVLSFAQIQNSRNNNTPVLRDNSALTPRYTQDQDDDMFDDSDTSLYGPSFRKQIRHEMDSSEDEETLIVETRPRPTNSKPAARHMSRAASKAKPATAAAIRKSIRMPSKKPAFSIQVEFVSDDEDEVDRPPPATVPRKFVVGLDYGTTFSSVAYVIHAIDDKTPELTAKDVKNIINWPQDRNSGARAQVPTEILYSGIPISRESRESEESESENEEPIARNGNHSGVGRRSGRGEVVQRAPDPRDGASPTLSHKKTPAHIWGYEAYHQKYAGDMQYSQMGHVQRAKLTLVNTKHTLDDRKKVLLQLEDLIQKGAIRKHSNTDNVVLSDVQDVITDFLVYVLVHTKQELIEREEFTDDCQISFALSVPTIWSPQSSRILQTCMQEAINMANFGSLAQLFIVSEPEAAATFLIGKSHKMIPGDHFAILDCGGGTVDGVAYTVTNGWPLRLKAELGKASGDNCGASYLNDAFEELLLEKLADEKYLDSNGETRADIVRQAVPIFEDVQKREINIFKRDVGRVRITGLRGDDYRREQGLTPKNFRRNYVELSSEDYSRIFLPLLKRTSKVLEDQIEGALAQGKDIKKVILIGGFGAAPSLRSYLKDYLITFVKQRNLPYDIELITADGQDSVMAIAGGAAIRATNLKHGPRRKAVSSYGFLRREPHEPKAAGLAGHKTAQVNIDPFNKQGYVTVIDYFLQMGEIVPAVSHYKPFRCTHAFDVNAEKFRCEEVLYVNDGKTKSHYGLDHEINRQAEEAGRIIVDMTFLRTENHIQPTMPAIDQYGIQRGRPRYEITYDLVPIVEGRDLRYEARYPPGELGEVKKSGQISIAAAFEAGTA